MDRNKKHAILPIAIGTFLILLALSGGILVSRYLDKSVATPEPTSKVIVVPARTPGPSVTPTISSIKLYALGAEIGSDGFTAYIGDRALTLSVVVEPKMLNLPVYWEMSDPESASLKMSDDRLSCSFTPLKPSGKNELTVRCYGAQVTIPVYLWDK